MNDRILVGTRKGLFTVRRHVPADWRVEKVEFLAGPISLALHDPRDGRLLVAINHGHFGVKLHRSDDGGASWEEVAAPRYPERAEGAPDEVDPFGRVIPWKLIDVWAFAAGGADQPGRVWCGTIPGGVFRSDDFCSSWEIVRSLWDDERRKQWFGGGADDPGVHSICVDPRDSRRVVLGVSCGGVWRTDDDGATWDLRADGMRAAYMPPEREFDPVIQDPHCVVQCPARPEQFWAQHHNGIFRSTDDLASWREIESAGPSTFGFPVAVHPDDPDTAWFVPAQKDDTRVPVDGRVVVTRTRDGGESFDVLTSGLPQEHAYDIVFRHALDIDRTGETLAFGSTTGSLWVSENGGDAWQTVSTHLPPVYCVRIA